MTDRQLLHWIIHNVLNEAQLDMVPPGGDDVLRNYALPRPRDTEREAFLQFRTSFLALERKIPDAWDAWQARASLSASTQPAVSAETRDAARYRWLRDNHGDTQQGGVPTYPALAQIHWTHETRGVIGDGPSIDAAIDTDMGTP